MKYIYNVIILVYKVVILFYSLFNNKASKIHKSQKGLLSKIYNATKHQKDIVWFHASSLGEYKQGKPVIELYKKKCPNHKILLTFYSSSGIENVSDKNIDFMFYLPHDTKKNAEYIVKKVKPIKAIFIKYDFWYNYIRMLYKSNIPIYYISCSFRKNQYFFRFYGTWFAKQLNKVTHFFVQDDLSSHLLKQINIKNISIVGDTRIDNVMTHKEIKYKNIIIEKFVKNHYTMIAGSTHTKDNNLLIQLYDKLQDISLKLIIAPHEITEINTIKKLPKAILLSNADLDNIQDYNLLIIDSIGILPNIYKYAKIAYVGGGFNKNIHNILEPTIYGLPVIFGPNYYKSKEAIEMIEINIASSINNEKELMKKIKEYKLDNSINKKCENFFIQRKGASKKIVAYI